MVKIYLGIGSNIDPDKNIKAGLRSLKTQFTNLTYSPTYLAPPFGFEGDSFHNLVVAAETDLPAEQVVELLRQVEFDHGRPEKALKYSSRSLDIDLLLYGDYVGEVGCYQIPRSDIDRFDFVLRPLQDIAASEKHPVSGELFSDLWQQMNKKMKSQLEVL